MTTIDILGACDCGGDILTCGACAADAKAFGGEVLREYTGRRGTALCDRRFPARFRAAAATESAVLAWVDQYLADPAEARSLLLAGPVGTGKTYQAYGTLRAVSASGLPVNWEAVAYADFTAELRPGGKDPEGSMRRYRDTPLLLLDDLGAAKSSEWVEEITYRLINHRYEAMTASILTTNVPLPELRETLGDRIASRLVEMCTVVSLVGSDRRRVKAPTGAVS